MSHNYFKINALSILLNFHKLVFKIHIPSKNISGKPDYPEKDIVFSCGKQVSIVSAKNKTKQKKETLLQAWPEGVTGNLMGIAQDWKNPFEKMTLSGFPLFLVEFGINGLQVPLSDAVQMLSAVSHQIGIGLSRISGHNKVQSSINKKTWY